MYHTIQGALVGRVYLFGERLVQIKAVIPESKTMDVIYDELNLKGDTIGRGRVDIREAYLLEEVENPRAFAKLRLEQKSRESPNARSQPKLPYLQKEILKNVKIPL
mgnify:FL=1